LQRTVVVKHKWLVKALVIGVIGVSVVFVTADNAFDDNEFTNEFDHSPNFSVRAKTTFDKYLIQAEQGDVKIQNFIGYMLFFGEGVEQNYDLAHAWFHRAAEAGLPLAKRNLGLLHARAVPGIPQRFLDADESNYWLSQTEKEYETNYNGSVDAGLYQQEQMYSDEVIAIDYFLTGTPFELGEKVYQTFCHGCHGINGIASYNAAPSFAKGERLNKDDSQLLASIKDGNGLMPAWGNTLSESLSENVLLYLRNGFVQQNNITSATNTDDSAIDANLLGAQTYSKYCAGCHGFNGIAYYVNSPSFALSQRLDKSDAQLKRSIRNGMNMMPDWGNKISSQEINAVVAYIRTLSRDFNASIDQQLKDPLSHYYRFRPKESWFRTKPVQ